MDVTTEKRIHKHCDKCGHNTFVSYDGTVYRCANCSPASEGASVRKVGQMNPKYTADQVLARARNRGGSGAGDEGLIEHLLYSRTNELDAERIDALKQALRIANDEDLKRRRA